SFPYSISELKIELLKLNIISESDNWNENRTQHAWICRVDGCTICFYQSTGHIKVSWQEKSDKFSDEKKKKVKSIFEIFSTNPDIFDIYESNKSSKQSLPVDTNAINIGAKKRILPASSTTSSSSNNSNSSTN